METGDPKLTGQTGIQITLTVCLLGYLTTYTHEGSSFGSVAHFSFWIAICSLSGFWIGLGSFPLRLPVVVATAITTAFVANDFELEDLAVYHAFSFTMIFVVAAVSFATRIIWGELKTTGKGSNTDTLQFRVRDVLIWTTSIAISLAIGRWLFTSETDIGIDRLSIIVTLTATHVVTCMVAVWAFLGDRMSVERIVAFMIVVVLATLVTNQFAAGDWQWSFMTPLSQLPIVATLYFLRLQDYRFVNAGAQ